MVLDYILFTYPTNSQRHSICRFRFGYTHGLIADKLAVKEDCNHFINGLQLSPLRLNHDKAKGVDDVVISVWHIQIWPRCINYGPCGNSVAQAETAKELLVPVSVVGSISPRSNKCPGPYAVAKTVQMVKFVSIRIDKIDLLVGSNLIDKPRFWTLISTKPIICIANGIGGVFCKIGPADFMISNVTVPIIPLQLWTDEQCLAGRFLRPYARLQ
jgi:hypothetical protein